MPKLMCLWPGLSHLWWHGAWFGLALAVVFTALANLTLAATLVWTDWLSPQVLVVCQVAVVAMWAVSTAVSLREQGRSQDTSRQQSADDAIREVHVQYLQGNWFEAERRLVRAIGRNPRDVDARLMLATLKRHTSRWDEAGEQLARLERFDDASKWSPEIGRERKLLAAAQSDAAGEDEADSTETAEAA